MKKSIPLLLGLLVLAALHGQGQNFHKVDTPKLDKADIKAERSWQRGSGGDDSRVVTREWNWLTMDETDLFQHAMPVLEANVDLCGERVLFVPDDMDGQKKICDFLPFIVGESYPNAFTDGKAVYFTKGMLREFRNPDEYRAVLGHEIGHVLAGHLRKKQRNAAIGSVLGGLAAAAAGVGGQALNDAAGLGALAAIGFSKKYELEADYIGAYFTARSGGSVDVAAGMWRRLGTGAKGSFLDSHPSSSERFVLLKATAEEIARKRENGEAIEPNLKRRAR